MISPCQVKLAITHHSISETEMIERQKALCFLMDPPKDREANGKPSKKKAKKNAGAMTPNSFGSVVDIPKLKNCSRLLIGWRVRPLGYSNFLSSCILGRGHVGCLNQGFKLWNFDAPNTQVTLKLWNLTKSPFPWKGWMQMDLQEPKPWCQSDPSPAWPEFWIWEKRWWRSSESALRAGSWFRTSTGETQVNIMFSKIHGTWSNKNHVFITNYLAIWSWHPSVTPWCPCKFCRLPLLQQLGGLQTMDHVVQTHSWVNLGNRALLLKQTKHLKSQTACFW